MVTVGVALSPLGKKFASTTGFRPATTTWDMSTATSPGRDA